jgi:triacylglycerol lipase
MDVGNAAPAPQWIGRAPHEPLAANSKPLVPDRDPFYVAPPGFEHAVPGTVLRSRDVELGFLGLIPQRVTAVQLLYRTTDLKGAPEAAVTTVIVPTERSPHRPCPLLSYQCAIDAVSARCFPSYAMRRRAHAIGAVPQFEYLLVAAAVAEGWAVSIPDHEGTNGSWGTPHEPGYRVLDGIRAALGYGRAGLSAEAPVGLWGYSGGGLATAWAAEECGSYAPDLNIVGAVLGSPVGDLGNTFRRLNGSIYAGLPATVVAALSHVYPDLDRLIQEHATDAGKAMLAKIERMTTTHAVLRSIGLDMGTLVDCPLEELLDSPEIRHVFDEIRLGATVPAPPVLIVQAVHDRIVSVDDIDVLAHTYDSAGANVTYHRDKFSEHLLLHPMSAPMTLRWLIDRFEGRPLDEHLVRTTWPTLLNPMTYRGMWRLGTVVARVITGRAVIRRPL